MVQKYSVILLMSLLLIQTEAVATDWPFLDTKRMGAADFIKQHPSYNGKDAVVIILDTGVDMGVTGLTELPDGSPKVIDVQDFSGEGDVSFSKADTGSENNEKYLTNEEGNKVFGYDKLNLQPLDSVYYIGVLNEDRFKNTVLPDINNNGNQNEHFAFIVFKSSEGWVAYVDLDADRNIDDEQPLQNYKEKLQSFRFRGRDKEQDRNLATFAINIFPEEKRVNFHYDGSSHGTHVAGISTGYKINGQDGLNGIAPGAKVISLKIGDCSLSGGATTTGSMVSAYEYGIEFAKKYDGPVVFNMSFGIGAEIEGQSAIDLTLDDFLSENEKLVFVTSAGNEGPGISTIGLPASSKFILTVGALNNKETANNLYGAHISSDKIFVFSSRGGELNKPDVLAPGGASSTVPPYSTRDVKWGTSMASPQAAGAVALVLSAAWQQKLPIVGAVLKKALKNSGDPLPGYLPLEQGSGVINIPTAFDVYKKLINEKNSRQVVNYDISTISPVYETEDGPAAYWRFGSYLPDKEHKQRFYINPVFSKKTDADARYNFYRGFTLKSGASWLKLNKKSTYIKGANPALVDVYFDKSKMKKPGLYNAKITAYRKGGLFASSSAVNKEFELMCTAVVPVVFNEQNGFKWSSKENTVAPGNVKRFFFDVPLKASAAAITLSAVRGSYSDLRAYLYDPAGREQHRLRIKSESKKSNTVFLKSDELDRGTWELDVYADFRNEQNSKFELSASFSGLSFEPKVISKVRIKNGSDPEGQVKVLNNYDNLAKCRISGALLGIQRIRHIADDNERYESTFSVDKTCERVQFDIELDAETYNLFTDFAINIKDYSGKTLHADGLSYRKLKFTFIPPQAGDYLIEFVPAFASHTAQDWSLTLKESYFYFNKIKIDGGYEEFYPRVNKETDFTVNGQIPAAPEGFYLFGELWLDSSGPYKNRTVVPIKLRTGILN